MTAADLPRDVTVGIISSLVESDAGQMMWLERAEEGGTVWLACGCRTRVPAADESHGLRLLRLHQRACGIAPATSVVTDPQRIDRAIVVVRAELVRVDSKAATLLALASTALTAGLALLGSGKLTGPAAGIGWLAVALLSAGILVLAAAVLPRLGGKFGLNLWASISPAELATLLAAEQDIDRAVELRSLSISVLTKYRRIQGGMAFLGLGVLAAIATAALNSQ